MSGIGDKIARFSGLHPLNKGGVAPVVNRCLARFENFGSNAGNLAAKVFVPDRRASGSSLVVLLHGRRRRDFAGLPSGSANGVSEALQRMRTAAPVRAAAVRDEISASGYAGPWPTVSVWHGTADHTVDSSNGAAIVEQWRTIHGLDA